MWFCHQIGKTVPADGDEDGWPTDPAVIFSRLDTNGDGILDPPEVRALMVLLGWEGVDDEYVDGLFTEYGNAGAADASPRALAASLTAPSSTDGTATIGPQEFAKMWSFLQGGGTPRSAATTPSSTPRATPGDGGGLQEDGMYYVQKNESEPDEEGAASGEVGFEEIARLVKAGSIDEKTMVFVEGMDGWKPYGDAAVQAIVQRH